MAGARNSCNTHIPNFEFRRRINGPESRKGRRTRMGYRQIHDRSLSTAEDFWSEAAAAIDWDRRWDSVLSDDGGPFQRWFAGGMLNTCHNALDRHVEAGRGDQTALIHDSPVTETIQCFTYRELRDQVAALAGELAKRIDDARPKMILSASCGIEPGRVVEYKPLLDRAIELAEHKPDATLILARAHASAALIEGRDFDWDTEIAAAAPVECVSVEATDPLYILYTSGTTGQPKGIVRDNGGHAVALAWSMPNVYNVKPGEVFWAASDVGWVVGHSYIVYGPLLVGATTLLFEGKPVGTPDAGTFWRLIERHKVGTLFTAPTAFRAIRKEDPHGEFIDRFDLSCLRALFLAGERCDPNTLEWAQRHLKVPVIDHWWQTETGWPVAADCLGIEELPVKPGSPTCAVPGFDVRVLDDDGRELPDGEIGAIVIKLPLPPGCLVTLWQADQRCRDAYLRRFPGYYLTGDAGIRDSDGYLGIMSRIDDVINVAGHRLSTGEMEEALASHPMVAECAVFGVQDALKGELPLGLVVLKTGSGVDEEQLRAELIGQVRESIGPVAAFKLVAVVERLPKTRSGKILRGTMRKIADGKEWTPPATIDDPAILDEIEQALVQMGYPSR